MTLLTALGNYRGGDASWMPPICPLVPWASVRNSQQHKQKYCLRPREQGLSQSLQHDKPNVRVKFLCSRLVGWFPLF